MWGHQQVPCPFCVQGGRFLQDLTTWAGAWDDAVGLPNVAAMLQTPTDQLSSGPA